MKIIFICLFFLISCSQSIKKNQESSQNTNYFLLKDASGEYLLKRELLQSTNRIQLRQSLFSSTDLQNPLEKSITISEFGVVKNKSIAIRPIASQFSIWFEKKKYFSQMKLNLKTKSFDIYLDSPEKKWQKKYSTKFVNGTKFCWFSQLPECVRKFAQLEKKKRVPVSFTLVWDSFPYYGEQYQGMAGKIFSQASIKFDSEQKSTLGYAVSVEGQVILYHFNQELEFEKMFWISQGITIIKTKAE